MSGRILGSEDKDISGRCGYLGYRHHVRGEGPVSTGWARVRSGSYSAYFVLHLRQAGVRGVAGGPWEGVRSGVVVTNMRLYGYGST